MPSEITIRVPNALNKESLGFNEYAASALRKHFSNPELRKMTNGFDKEILDQIIELLDPPKLEELVGKDMYWDNGGITVPIILKAVDGKQAWIQTKLPYQAQHIVSLDSLRLTR